MSTAWRVTFRRYRKHDWSRESLVVVGHGDRAQEALDGLLERYIEAAVEEMECLGDALVCVAPPSTREQG